MDAHTSLSFVRSNREVFLGPSGKVDLRDFAGQLVVDALCLGAEDVRVRYCRGWYVVSSRVDWLSVDTTNSVLDSFLRLRPFPQHRSNSHRASLVVAAFAKNLITIEHGHLTVVVGVADEQSASQASEILSEYGDSARVVAFSGVAAVAP